MGTKRSLEDYDLSGSFSKCDRHAHVSKESSLRDAVLNSSHPFVISNYIDDWEFMSYSLTDWQNFWGEKKLNFRSGKTTPDKLPYWESKCSAVEFTFKEFCSRSEQSGDEWFYFDYKYMKDLFQEEILEKIKWSNMGFCEYSGKDSTMWIGSKGSHTPCHMDTYGCNLVAQILGYKQWILIPPSETSQLKPVRVPYEESSIYSSVNFAAPDETLLDIDNMLKVVLRPGDVLFVPRHWWHYVENLDLAISINCWIPMEVDIESQLEEALVRCYMQQLCQTLPESESKLLLNPNEYDLLTEERNPELINYLINKCNEFRSKHQAQHEITCNLHNIRMVEKWTRCDKQKYMEERKLCDTNLDDTNNTLDNVCSQSVYERLINAFCHPETISSVKENLLKQ